MQIPRTEQIDAILSGRIWNLVQKYCNGSWSSLPSAWSVTCNEILDEAQRRGFACFVHAKPLSEGYWLCPSEAGYEVFYFERGIRMYKESFTELASAFEAWLRNELRSLQLPTNA